MPSTFTSSLRLELQADGENDTTWGDKTNDNLSLVLEPAIAGQATVTLSDADHTLTVKYGEADEARSAILIFNGTLSVRRNVICPAVPKWYIVRNITAGGFGVMFKTKDGSGVEVPNGDSFVLYCDGTNILTAGSSGAAGSITPDKFDTDPASWVFNGFLGVNRTHAVDPNFGVFAMDGVSGSYQSLYLGGTLMCTWSALASSTSVNINSPLSSFSISTGNTVRVTFGLNGVTTFTTPVVVPSLTVENTAPTLALTETDTSITRTVNLNNAQIGFTLSNGVFGLYNDNSGNTVSLGDVTAFSDARFKKNWVDLPENFLYKLIGVKYGTYTDKASGQRRAGVTAQSLQNALDEAVLKLDGDYLGVSYGNAALVSVIRAAEHIVALENKVKELVARIDALEKKA